jgi:hypothetical protein
MNNENSAYNEALSRQVAAAEAAMLVKAEKANKGRMGYGSVAVGTKCAQDKDKKDALDFRFADEEDAAEIVALVNEAYKAAHLAVTAESKPAIGVGEEDVQDRVSGEEVLRDLLGETRRRWLVVETDQGSDSVIVSALRMSVVTSAESTVNSTSATASVDIIATAPAASGSSAASLLLKRFEATARNTGCGVAQCGAGHWQSRAIEWLKKRGYGEFGGELWPVDRRSEVPKSVLEESMSPKEGAYPMPVMMLHLRKDLSLAKAQNEEREEAEVAALAKKSQKSADEKLLGALSIDADELSFMQSIAAITRSMGASIQQPDVVLADGGGGGGEGREGEEDEEIEGGAFADILAALEAGDVEEVEIDVGNGIETLPLPTEEDVIGSGVIRGAGAEAGGEDDLEGLVGNLLKALKTDDGRAKFKELAAIEDEFIKVEDLKF